MKIKRTLGGIEYEIELTSEEIQAIAYEQELAYDILNAQDSFCEYMSSALIDEYTDFEDANGNRVEWYAAIADYINPAIDASEKKGPQFIALESIIKKVFGASYADIIGDTAKFLEACKDNYDTRYESDICSHDQWAAAVSATFEEQHPIRRC